jgi:hypothetical protein
MTIPCGNEHLFEMVCLMWSELKRAGQSRSWNIPFRPEASVSAPPATRLCYAHQRSHSQIYAVSGNIAKFSVHAC